MNSERLQDIKSDCARVVIQWSNGVWDARFAGHDYYQSVWNEMLRLHYLWAIVKNARLSGASVYLGDTEIADNILEQVKDKIWHYNGRFASIDMTDWIDVSNIGDDGTITQDDGDGDTVTDTTPTSDDHYRSDGVPVVVGANAVSFIKNGVVSPLASSDYTVQAWVIAESGQRQNNLVITTQTAGGFVASDVLKAGTLYYIATLNT